MKSPYGIIANLCGSDNAFNDGQKLWLHDGRGGEGWERFIWLGQYRQKHRHIKKWLPTKRVHNCRAAWIPEHIRELAQNYFYICGSQEEMEAIAIQLNDYADQLRAN